MKKVLITYNFMMIGGSTTSLLSILNGLDYTQYQVDLLLLYSDLKVSPLITQIPPDVNILPQALPFLSKKEEKIYKLTHLKSLATILKTRYLAKHPKDYPLEYTQLLNIENARISHKLDNMYDVAIAFVETWSVYYVAKYVNAKKKIGWFHPDYKSAGFNPKIDYPYFSKFDKIVLVSNKCKASFDEVFPSLSNHTMCIENILSQSVIRSRADENTSNEIVGDQRKIKAVTTARITFYSKGLDRVVNALEICANRGILDRDDPPLLWYVIGDGPDFETMKSMIKQKRLQNIVIMLGKKTNPLPLEKLCDCFILPSRYEGKPMAVTEAMMLGLPAIVTNYASAEEQILQGVDGAIFTNSDDGCIDLVKYLIENADKIIQMKKNTLDRDYSNTGELDKIIELLQ